MITNPEIIEKAKKHLSILSQEIPTRQVGSQGNQDAIDYFAGQMRSFGFQTERTEFECVDWRQEGVDLRVGGEAIEAFSSLYSLGCQVTAPLAVASTVEEIEGHDLRGNVLLLRGEVAKEQLMPKNFPFYNPEEHARIYRALEAAAPAAIISASPRNPEMAGAVYPLPMFEDGDFDIPSVYLTEELGERLAGCQGAQVELSVRAERIPAKATSLVARKGQDFSRRVVVIAHIDAKIGTPGATDNGTGVTALLLLGELLQEYRGKMGIEIVPMNGEDNYANPGEKIFIQQNIGRFGEIVLGINLDGIAYHHGQVAYTLYEAPEEISQRVHAAMQAQPGVEEGQPWFQGDHTLLLQNGVPALALTTSAVGEAMATIIHTSKDTLEVVDFTQFPPIVLALRDILLGLSGE